MGTFYLTTAIDYPNGPPHIGHSLEKIAADVVARYHRLRGDDTFFAMGLDENSQHVIAAAEAAGVSARVWVDRMDEAFRLAWRKVGCSYDRWIRTTEPAHFRASQELFRRARDNGDIYRGSYAGYYCPLCNTFYTADELTPEGTCPNHPGVRPEWLEEENYFFALSRYTERLTRHVEAHPEFIVPATWRAEILATLRSGLRDFSVSRPVRSAHLVDGQPWGVPVPDDPEHVIYVWFDALTNYLTAAGFPDEPERFARTWPAAAHVIGKDITRFHCLYWPAMLLSAGLPLPRSVAVHGFMTLDGQRISKSTGNIIDPVELVDAYGADALRFYLMRDISFERDGDFTRANLIQRYNADLANDLGNLLNRTVSMIGRYAQGAVPAPEGEAGQREASLIAAAREAEALTREGIERWDFDAALDGTWQLVRRANQYIDENEPWRLARDPAQGPRLGTVLYHAAESLRLLGILLAPFIPGAAGQLRAQLGLDPLAPGAWRPGGGAAAGRGFPPLPGSLAALARPGRGPQGEPAGRPGGGEARWGLLPAGTRVGRAQPLFPRIEAP